MIARSIEAEVLVAALSINTPIGAIRNGHYNVDRRSAMIINNSIERGRGSGVGTVININDLGPALRSVSRAVDKAIRIIDPVVSADSGQ